MRAIDADRLLDRCKFYHLPNGDIAVPIIDVQHAPTIEIEPNWIPVTERLPKPRESVIISVNGKYGDWIGEGCYWETTEDHVIWKGYRWNATYWDDEIIAWMPLPEPYQEV